MTMLRRIEIDDDTADYCERRVTGLLSSVKAIAKFPEGEIITHFDSLELARDRLSEILDKAEGK